ncbi:MAG: hypothetical protein ACI8P0_002012 [Planctomycetaceae bacterium]|jgi:hypothetical protein
MTSATTESKDQDSPVVVFSSPERLRAELMKSMLEAASIECHLANGQQAAFAGIGLFPVEIIVAESDAEQARQLILKDELRHDA